MDTTYDANLLLLMIKRFARCCVQAELFVWRSYLPCPMAAHSVLTTDKPNCSICMLLNRHIKTHIDQLREKSITFLPLYWLRKDRVYEIVHQIILWLILHVNIKLHLHFVVYYARGLSYLPRTINRLTKCLTQDPSIHRLLQNTPFR